MAQDVSPQEYPQGAGQPEGRKRSAIWPWLLLVLVLLLVAFLLWLYWRTPSSSTVKSIEKTTVISVEAPEPRPEPVVPVNPGALAESAAAEAPVVSGSQAGITSRSVPKVVEVKMPGIVGLTQAAAEDKVKNAGLVPYLTYGDNPSTPVGHVISQWPLAGEMLPKGSEGFIQIQLQ